MKVFLFGAGASAGTIPQIPVSRDFGAILNQHAGSKEFPAVSKAVNHLGLPQKEFSLEKVWTCLDFYAKLEEALPARKPWRNDGPDIKRAVLRVYGKRCDRLADRLPRSASYTLGRLMKNEVSQGDLLVSFNYDTLVERLAVRFGHKLCAVGCTPSRHSVLLSKPHGSASWTMDLNSRKVTWHGHHGSPLLVSLREQEVEHRREPLVLGAVPIKSELIREVQCGFPEIFLVVTRQWKGVVDALKKSNTVVVVGYSFPREDLYGRFMFAEAMRHRKRNLRVQYFDLPDLASARCKEIVDVFGHRISRLEYRGQVETYRRTRRRS